MDQNIMQFIQNLLRGSFQPSSVGNFLGQNLPGAPNFDTMLGDIGNISDTISSLFSPDRRNELMAGMFEQGMGNITDMGGQARRAIGSRASATGMGDSSPVSGMISGTFGQQQQAISGLENQTQQFGFDYDQQLLQALLSQAGLMQQQAGLMQQGFGNQLDLAQMGAQSLPNFLDMFSQLDSIRRMGGFNG